MENLRQINDLEHLPIKGDNLKLNDRLGILLDNEFNQIQWSDNDEIEDWIGGWESFIQVGGFLLIL